MDDCMSWAVFSSTFMVLCGVILVRKRRIIFYYNLNMMWDFYYFYCVLAYWIRASLRSTIQVNQWWWRSWRVTTFHILFYFIKFKKILPTKSQKTPSNTHTCLPTRCPTSTVCELVQLWRSRSFQKYVTPQTEFWYFTTWILESMEQPHS